MEKGELDQVSLFCIATCNLPVTLFWKCWLSSSMSHWLWPRSEIIAVGSLQRAFIWECIQITERKSSLSCRLCSQRAASPAFSNMHRLNQLMQQGQQNFALPHSSSSELVSAALHCSVVWCSNDVKDPEMLTAAWAGRGLCAVRADHYRSGSHRKAWKYQGDQRHLWRITFQSTQAL